MSVIDKSKKISFFQRFFFMSIWPIRMRWLLPIVRSFPFRFPCHILTCEQYEIDRFVQSVGLHIVHRHLEQTEPKKKNTKKIINEHWHKFYFLFTVFSVYSLIWRLLEHSFFPSRWEQKGKIGWIFFFVYEPHWKDRILPK